MVSYEEAIANLERAYLILDEAASRDKGISSNQTFRCCGAVHDMLTLLKEPEPVKPTWVGVQDRLPEDGQLVVVRHEVKGRIYSEVANYIMNLWWLDWDSNGLKLNAISWFPLPEPEEEM